MNIDTLKKMFPAIVIVWLDWSVRRGVVVLREGEVFTKVPRVTRAGVLKHEFQPNEYTIFPSILAAMRSFSQPAAFVLERTFESFNLAERKKILAYAEEHGHQVWCLPTRLTTKARVNAGFAIEKDADTLHADLEDVQALRHETLRGVELRQFTQADLLPIKERDPAYYNAFKVTAERLMKLRSQGEMVKQKSGRYLLHTEQEKYARDLIARLPDINEMPEPVRKALGTVKGRKLTWNETAIATLGVLAETCSSVSMFDRVSGLHAQAYGSQARSNLNFWVYAGGGPRRKLDSVTRKRADDLTLSEFRKACRVTWRMIRDLRTV